MCASTHNTLFATANQYTFYQIVIERAKQTLLCARSRHMSSIKVGLVAQLVTPLYTTSHWYLTGSNSLCFIYYARLKLAAAKYQNKYWVAQSRSIYDYGYITSRNQCNKWKKENYSHKCLKYLTTFLLGRYAYNCGSFFQMALRKRRRKRLLEDDSKPYHSIFGKNDVYDSTKVM